MSDNFTFNFNAPVGQNIAKVDKMIVNMDKDGKIQVMNAENLEMPPLKEQMTNEELDTLCDKPSPEKDEPMIANEDTDSHTNIELRRKRLKQSYDELLKTNFNKGSDWYYIYRMMEDNTIYTHDYQSFLDDLVNAGIDISRIHKSSFTEISKRIKEETKFPNWKVHPGKQQKVIENGIEYARIAFNILFK